MRTNFEEALGAVLIHEGGYVDHPRDPGGATNMGITHKTYASWLRVNGLPQKNVRDITADEVATIYKEQYWDAVKADSLPSGVDYAVFDFAVNSGPSRAAKFLQRVVGATEDGMIGQQTLASVQSMPSRKVVVDLCDNRLAWLKRLSHWGTFGKGWSRRVAEVRAKGVRLAEADPNQFADLEATGEAPGKATGPEKVTASIADILTNRKGLGGAAAVATPVAALAAEGDGPLQWGLAAALGFIGLAVLVWVWRGTSK